MQEMNNHTDQSPISRPTFSLASILRHLSATRVYLWLGGLSLILLVFFTPPFQVPDEPQHFYRSYQLSELKVWRGKDAADSAVPVSLFQLVQDFMGTIAFHSYREVPRIRLVDTLAELHRPLDAERLADFDLSGVQGFAPLPYVPQALAMAAGRAMGVGPLGLLYMGRLANALVAGLITAFAIALLPIGRTVALVVALLPMTLFQMASVSPDALTIASALLFTAVMVRFLVDDDWRRARKVTAFVSGLLMCITKVVYLPLLFAGLGAMFGAGRFSDPKIRRSVYMQLAAAVATIVLAALWYWSTHAVHSPGPSTVNLAGPTAPQGINSAAQMAYLASDVFNALSLVFRSLSFNAEFLSKSALGLLGWLNVPLPPWAYLVLGLALPLSAFAQPDARAIGKVTALWLLLVAVAVVPAVEFALYVAWTPVGAYFVEGVQGRYFIPALPMLGVAVAALVNQYVPTRFAWFSYFCVVGILCATTVTMHLTLIRYYGLF